MLKLQLVKDSKVLFEVPLSMEDWPRELLYNELDSIEQEFDRFSKLFTALSNENRFRMMRNLFEDEDLKLGFADFMRNLSLNPKIVWESTRKLQEGGLLEKSDDGKYKCSEFGEAGFIVLSLALKRLRQALRELEEW
jgi:DNA-binding transcriptional ArsR family regulator